MYKLWAAILILSFISCSGENTNGGPSGTPGTTGGEVGNEGQVPEHWIFSVPFQKIDAGSFTMGSPPTDRHRESDENQVFVEISKSFEIMEKELTQKQWFLIKKENPSKYNKHFNCGDHEVIEGVEMCPNHPVEDVSWEEVQEYIRELNNSLGLSGCKGRPDDPSGCYRLPTEAEWEYAVRGGTETIFFFGDDWSDLGDYAWYSKNFYEGEGLTRFESPTHRVGTRKVNPEGLYDVYGNVWEWVQDKYVSQLPGGKNPLNEDSGSYHALRGGSWNDIVWDLRSANRYDGEPIMQNGDIGFRLVRTL